MDQQPKKPQLTDEEIRARLKQGARQRKPWTLGSVLMTLLLLGLPLGLVLWWFWPRAQAPHVLVVAGDQLCNPNQETQVTATLIRHEKEEPTAELAGWPVHFQLDWAPAGQPASSGSQTSTTEGLVRWSLTAPATPAVATIKAEYAAHKYYRGEDRARLFCWSRDVSVLLVDLPSAVSKTELAKWQTANIQEVALDGQVATALLAVQNKGYRLVYLATAEPLLYRKLRGWLQLHAATGKLPDGPVLGCTFTTETEAQEELTALRQVRELFPGKCHALSTGADQTARYRQVGIKVVQIAGGAEVDAGVSAVKDWSELAAKLP